MKLFVPLFLLLLFISLAGCKNTQGNSTEDGKTPSDTTSIASTKAEFKVNGMHCTGCENTIKTNIKELDGVSSVEASFKDNIAVVSFDSTKTSPELIVSAIEEAGYKVDTFLRK
jgi:copper ion binding protein